MARPEPVDPCPECCRRENCRLPLNCPKYLKFQQEVQQVKADEREMRLCTLHPQEISLSSRTIAYYREIAQACPWEPVEGNSMEKINMNHDEAMRLCKEGATIQQMAETLGVSKAVVSRWKKENGLSKGQDADRPTTGETEQPPKPGSHTYQTPVTARELAVRDGTQRVEALMHIMRDDDCQLVRNLFGNLACAITRQFVEIAVNAAAAKKTPPPEAETPETAKQ